MSAVIHLTVPGSFTGRRKGVRVHHQDLMPGERRVWDDVPVTTVERTLIDLAGRSDPSLLSDAVRESLDRGLTTRARLAVAVGDTALLERADLKESIEQMRHGQGCVLRPVRPE